MRIHEIDQTGVCVHLTPSECLLLADACHRAGLEHQAVDYTAATVFDLAAAHLEGLALLGAAQGQVAENDAFLARWTLAQVRRERAIGLGTREVRLTEEPR